MYPSSQDLVPFAPQLSALQKPNRITKARKMKGTKKGPNIIICTAAEATTARRRLAGSDLFLLLFTGH
jgi:hypothetical protein